ncbi:MAG: hypothetical protein AABY07_11115 [Nanoarchaeota archaeon]
MDQSIHLKILEYKKEISDLRNKIRDLSKKKNELYNKKEELFNIISSNITELKELRKGIENYKSIKEELKNKRDSSNKKFKELISEIKSISQEKRELFKKSNIKDDPKRLKGYIEKLETRIETEALQFETEKKLMTKIKELKRKYESISKISNLNDSLFRISEDVSLTKKIADEFHQQLLEKVNKNKDNYDKFIELSKRTNETRKEKNKITDEYKKTKDEIRQLYNQIQEKMIELNKLYAIIGEEKKIKEEQRRREVEEILLEKTRSVEEKLKNREKLTTQDLIILQAKKDSDLDESDQ